MPVNTIAIISAGLVVLVISAILIRKKRSSKNRGVVVVDRVTGKISIIRPFQDESDTDPKNGRSGVGLQGNLAQTPLHDLLQYLSLGSKSGILELTCGRRTGRVVLRDGKVCKSSYRDKEGPEAMFMMMDLSEGDFEFYEQALAEPPSQEDMEVVDIIMLWMDGKPKQKSITG